METMPFSKSQQAYLKVKTRITALHKVIDTRPLQYKQYTLAAFLNIEGSFKNEPLEFDLPRLNEHRFILSSNVKYLDAILGSKLSRD